MKSPEEIEAALKRLIPAAVSEELTERVFADISAPSVQHKTKNYYPYAAIAAAVAIAACATLFLSQVKKSDPVATVTLPSVKETVSQIIDTKNTVREEEQGIIASEDGNVHRAIRRTVVKHQRIRDARTGYIITVSTPHKEQILMPVSSF